MECPQAVSVRLRICHTSRKMNHFLCTQLHYFHKMQNTAFILSQDTQERISHESILRQISLFRLNLSLFCAVALLLFCSPALSLSYPLAVSLYSLGLKHSLFLFSLFVMQSFFLSDSLYRLTLALSFSFFSMSQTPTYSPDQTRCISLFLTLLPSFSFFVYLF